MLNNYTIKDNTVEIEVFYKKNRLIVVVDLEFLPVLEFLPTKWTALTNKYGRNYYIRCKYKKKLLHLHRLVCGDKKGLVVDHINRNTLDNRKENLRNITHNENIRNSHRAK
jgi:hypothetical protein